MIQKRILFARKELRATGRLPTFPSSISLDSSRLDQYIGILEDAFLDNEAIIEFVENMSGGNVRRALDFIVSFVGSGHVDARKIFDILRDRGRYVLPIHEFVRAVMYGEHIHFDPSDSPIGNLFDIAFPDGREHFLLPLLLSLSERVGKPGSGQAEEGFVPIESFFETAQGLGFEPMQVEFALSRARSKKMFDAFPRFTLEEWGENHEPPTHLRITSVGAYTLRRLVRMFTYVDAIVVDTPIVDRGYADRIFDVQTIGERLERARVFREYLDAQWMGLGRNRDPYDWGPDSVALQADIARAEAGANRRAVR